MHKTISTVVVTLLAGLAIVGTGPTPAFATTADPSICVADAAPGYPCQAPVGDENCQPYIDQFGIALNKTAKYLDEQELRANAELAEMAASNAAQAKRIARLRDANRAKSREIRQLRAEIRRLRTH